MVEKSPIDLSIKNLETFWETYEKKPKALIIGSKKLLANI